MNVQEIIVPIQRLADRLEYLERSIKSERDYYKYSLKEIEKNTPEYYLIVRAYLALNSIGSLAKEDLEI